MEIASHLTSLEMLDNDFIENAEVLGRCDEMNVTRELHVCLGGLITEIPLDGISSFIFRSTTMWLISCLLDHDLTIKNVY